MGIETKILAPILRRYLNLFATDMNQKILILDQITQFSNDIGMKFGESKRS